MSKSISPIRDAHGSGNPVHNFSTFKNRETHEVNNIVNQVPANTINRVNERRLDLGVARAYSSKFVSKVKSPRRGVYDM
jgi:hypothetical protein